jgi:hypothetical protein
MPRLRFALVAVALAGALFATATQAAPQKVTKLYGQDGPGFTITLKKANFVLVRHLKPGLYTLKIDDRSTIHNFHLKGPGVDKKTAIRYLGTKMWVKLRLKKGTYKYWCDAHRDRMHGSFKVV